MKPFLKVLKTIGNVVGYALIGILVAISAFVMIMNAKGEMPFIGKYGVLFVMTDSMSPSIEAESTILVKKVDDVKSLIVGDVIVFLSSDPSIQGKRNTHRIVRIVGDYEEFVTKGDNNVKEDDYTVNPENVVAKYERVLPVLTRFNRVLSKKTGVMIIGVMILIVLMIMYLPDLKKAEKKRAEEAAKAKQEKAALIDEMVAKEVAKLMENDEAIRKLAEEKMKAETGGSKEPGENA